MHPSGGTVRCILLWLPTGYNLRGPFFRLLSSSVLRALLLFFFQLEGVSHKGSAALDVKHFKDAEKLDLVIIQLPLKKTAIFYY